MADQSEAGWTLIDKLGKSRVPSEIKATETAILSDRRGKKRAYGNGFSSDSQNFGQNPSPPNFGPGPSAQRFGPCIWCGGQGHGYKTCRAWKEDVTAGRAHFHQNNRRWYRVQTADIQPSQPHAYTQPPPKLLQSTINVKLLKEILGKLSWGKYFVVRGGLETINQIWLHILIQNIFAYTVRRKRLS